ncbi:hypothetical protein ACFQZ4_06990 [Catellatospora coxensis]
MRPDTGEHPAQQQPASEPAAQRLPVVAAQLVLVAGAQPAGGDRRGQLRHPQAGVEPACRQRGHRTGRVADEQPGGVRQPAQHADRDRAARRSTGPVGSAWPGASAANSSSRWRTPARIASGYPATPTCAWWPSSITHPR